MPDRTFTSCTLVPEIILHDRRLRLSPAQAQVLTVRLTRRGPFVANQEWDARDPERVIAQLRSLVEPHGLAMYRGMGAAYLLLEAP
ncbi:MAG: hypothetical protein WCD86_00480 [Ktedonobacteraceae bacterium]